MCPFLKIEEISLLKKVSTFMGTILDKSHPIFINHMRYQSAIKFPTIWEVEWLCSFIRLEVMIKNVICVLFRYQILVRRGNLQKYIKKAIPYNALPHESCGRVSVGPHKSFMLNFIHNQTSLAHFLNFLCVWVHFFSSLLVYWEKLCKIGYKIVKWKK